MNISEQANKYAEGKANEAITKAIADAYMEGYKAGYKDREEEIPMELRDNKTEYVDLGLPSGTLWAADYEKLDGELLYLPYCEAEKMNLPTKEQLEELLSNCKWMHNLGRTTCLGPNGTELYFENTGTKHFQSSIIEKKQPFFWLENNDNTSNAVYLSPREKCAYMEFSGYKLPVRMVSKD